jgi:hypothetical protein
MSSAGADSLKEVFAFVDHLVVVNGSDLRVVGACDLGVEESSAFEEIRASLGNRKAAGTSLTGLVAGGDEARPGEEVVDRGETLDVADEGDEDSGAVLGDAGDGFEVTERMKLSIERVDDVELKGMLKSFPVGEARLFAREESLQEMVVDRRGRAVEVNDLIGFLDERGEPIQILVGSGVEVKPGML